ncbi:MAG: alpha/beta hydrolase family protein [Janthinobacterium lividum]
MSAGPAAQVIEVATPQGPGHFHVSEAGTPVALLVLGHGAGGGVDAPDLTALAHRLPGHGVTVLRYEQPWRVAGRRVAVRPPLLDEAWLAGLEAVLQAVGAGLPLVVGGRSAGARVACRTATTLGAAGVVCLSFPLHLPGRPERPRLPELLAPTAPRLVLQGTRDTFGGAAELAADLAGQDGAAGVRLVVLDGADHGARVPKGASPTAAELRDLVVATTATFVEELLRGQGIPAPAAR